MAGSPGSGRPVRCDGAATAVTAPSANAVAAAPAAPVPINSRRESIADPLSFSIRLLASR
jgi:hypothetical protein